MNTELIDALWCVTSALVNPTLYISLLPRLTGQRGIQRTFQPLRPHATRCSGVVSRAVSRMSRTELEACASKRASNLFHQHHLARDSAHMPGWLLQATLMAGKCRHGVAFSGHKGTRANGLRDAGRLRHEVLCLWTASSDRCPSGASYKAPQHPRHSIYLQDLGRELEASRLHGCYFFPKQCPVLSRLANDYYG